MTNHADRVIRHNTRHTTNFRTPRDLPPIETREERQREIIGNVWQAPSPPPSPPSPVRGIRGLGPPSPSPSPPRTILRPLERFQRQDDDWMLNPPLLNNMLNRNRSATHINRPMVRKQLVREPKCAICLNDFSRDNGPVSILPCQHIYHENCISQLHNNICPECRTSFEMFGHRHRHRRHRRRYSRHRRSNKK